MRYLILSDIHGNADALRSVLEDAGDDFDAVLVLGDLVGYGASPNEVVERVRALSRPEWVVRGNHDKVCSGLEPDDQFNSVARAAARWTASVLRAENLEYLRQMRQGPTEIRASVFICHGSPLQEDEYILSLESAAEVFSQHVGRVFFFGHTHLPMSIESGPSGISMTVPEGDEQEILLDPERRYLLNPGAVGQPRDRDPRAAYFVYEPERGRVLWRRCEYPVEEAQGRILEAGLPVVLAHRLAAGL